MNLQKIIEKQEELIQHYERKPIYFSPEWNYKYKTLESELASLKAQEESKTVEEIKRNHKCIPIAKACMGEGREWWCGELTEQIKKFPQETHCLHLKTEYSNVVFLCNVADFQQLQLLGASITGEINSTWFKSMLKVVKNNASQIEQKEPTQFAQPSDVSDEDIEKWASIGSKDIKNDFTANAKSFMRGVIFGAKAHRDGKIKKGE